MGGRSLDHADPFEKGGRGVTRLIVRTLEGTP